jgi:hypothetical protein
MPGPRRCGICHQPGHDRRNCNNDPAWWATADPLYGPRQRPGWRLLQSGVILIRCHICQQIGHTARNCNSDLAREAQQRAHDLLWTGDLRATELVGEEEGSSVLASADATPDTETQVTESDTCPICMENLEKTNCCITSCGHQFCLECIIKHSNTKSDCPLCRGNLLRTGVREHATLPPAAPTVDALFPAPDTFRNEEIMYSMLNRVNGRLLDHALQPPALRQAELLALGGTPQAELLALHYLGCLVIEGGQIFESFGDFVSSIGAGAIEGGGTAAEIDLTVDAGSETEGESDYESESDYVSDILALPAAVQPLFAHLLMGEFESQI